MASVKRAVSLPKELDSYLSAIAKESGRSYSGLVCEAVSAYMKSAKQAQLEAAYRKYYSDKRRAKADAKLARIMANASAKNWPDWDPE